MILSMTGYGKSVATYNDKKIHVEVKSLNSKTLDLSMRISPLYREREIEMRQMVAAELIRGKIDMVVWIERDATASITPFNADTIAFYYNQLKTIVEANEMPEPADYLTPILRIPDIMIANEQELLEDEEWTVVCQAIHCALQELTSFRQQEGKALEEKFKEKIDNIENYLYLIDKYEHGRVEKIKNRLKENLSQIKEVNYDNNRLEQELIYYIEKLDISEEKQRLANHLNYFRTTMNEQGGQGKKLGFIAQEMGREINTTGSKSNNAEMQNIVVKMKDELEQIKEQVLNVL